ncbi:MAG: NADH-quinone oxidoreductase subunit NuoH [Acidimicrobiia bacterium]|nr:NADH-quinone oxidoreductase subunit NuoH [Acidimicrobiia bacterium]NNF10445.1 NADH-quinone oxidoreductase subunit NuoH [Acidimicrobiia bacterium]NNL69490.1 NADH-quinone oxidoreductase subunit NuoH [Acidimicrobiia bacterium]
MTDWIDVLIVAIKVVAAFVIMLVATLMLIWAERKILADMQNRVGPDRAGPGGILQGLADGIKLFFKEPITPARVEKGIYLLAPILALIPALLMFLVVPIGRPFSIGDREITLQVMDLNVGLLFVLAVSSMAVYAVVLAGWSSGSKYPLLGGVRATAQAISYEAALGLSLVPVVIYEGTLSVAELVEGQSGQFFGIFPAWNIILLPSFAFFLMAAVAETNRAPFDLVEAENELVGGFHTEYSGLRFALFFLAEYINIFTMSALAATIFLGGWNGPTWDGALPASVTWIFPILWFGLKTFAIVFIFFWVRATLPRFRYDQLMELGWKRLIPGTLIWMIFVAIALAFDEFGAPWA